MTDIDTAALREEWATVLARPGYEPVGRWAAWRTPDLLDEVDRLRATLARVEALRDEWARDGEAPFAPTYALTGALNPDTKEADRG